MLFAVVCILPRTKLIRPGEKCYVCMNEYDRKTRIMMRQKDVMR